MPVGTCAACEAALPERPALTGADLLHGAAGEFSVHVCTGCGAGNTRPAVSAEELASHYPSGYRPFGSGGRLAPRLARAPVRREMRVGAASELLRAPPGKLLDVGCGDGRLGAEMIKLGWRVDGVEPSRAACELARARGVAAREGTLDTVELSRAGYDAVIFNHSLEHVADPVAALAAARDAARPQAPVLVSVPNFDSWARRRFGREWFHLDLPRHRTHFNVAALELVAERAGLRTRRTWTTTSPTGLAGSLQYRWAGGLVIREGRARDVLGQLAGLALVPVARVEQALGGGGDFLHLAAQRPAS